MIRNRGGLRKRPPLFICTWRERGVRDWRSLGAEGSALQSRYAGESANAVGEADRIPARGVVLEPESSPAAIRDAAPPST